MLIDEIKLGGLGDSLVREQDTNSNKQVRTAHVMEWIHAMERGIKLIAELALQFGNVEILEHYNDYFKLRVLRQDKTIGFLFGMIEGLKEELGIQEYSVSQTTLEQIFAMFANMALDSSNSHLVFKHDLLNPMKVSKVETTIFSGPIVS